MVMAIDEVVADTIKKHHVDEGRDQWQKHLEDENVGQREKAHGAVADKCGAMLPHRLQRSEGPAEALPHQSLGVDGRFGKSERAVFVVHAKALFEQIHGQVGVFRNRVDGIAAGGLHRSGAPRANGSGYDRDNVEEIECAALEILAGDVFQSLPSRPQVHTIAHLGVAGHGADARVFEVRNQLGDGVGGDDCVGVDADVDFFREAVECVVKRGSLASVGLGEHLHAAGDNLRGVGFASHLGGAVG